jgi:hypothetical protein
MREKPTFPFDTFMEVAVRKLAQSLILGTSIVIAMSATPAAAASRYCLQGREWGYPGNCQFSSYQQCMAAASGTDAYCGINPRHAFARERRGHRYRYRY